MAATDNPQISVIIVTPDCYQTIRRTIGCVRRQTIRDALEVIIVAPSAACLKDGDGELSELNYQVVEVGPIRSTAVARAAGIRRASAPIVALAEDHSFPAPNWAETFLERHREAWAAVGPAMCNANPGSALSWSNLAIEYGPWLDPVPSGPADHLPGHNGSYKRDLLLAYGDELGLMLESESVLHWDLRAKGHALYLDSKTRTYHLNYSLIRPTLLLRFLGGRQFGAMRARHWSTPRRLLYGIASPLIPLIRLGRVLRGLCRAGQLFRFSPKILALTGMSLVSDAMGEMCGYLFGSNRTAMARLSEMEFHRHRFVRRRDLIREEQNAGA
jgi:glycosyltransferase involved in cell wall biosynthesis